MSTPNRFALLLCLCISTPALAGPQAAEAEIRHIVERFQEALTAKDGDSLRAMFLPKDNSWLSVASDGQMAKWHREGKNEPRLRVDTHQDFIARIVADADRNEEQFNTVKIHTDGAIASVHFDFVFLSNGRPVNRGEEAWHLVKTDAGWKISSLIYSINEPDAQPAPRR